MHVVLTKNPGVNSAEFGIRVNARTCQVQINPDLTMIIPEYDAQNGMIWFTWVTGNEIDLGTIILDVQIPYDCIGDINWYPVDYVSKNNERSGYWANVDSEGKTSTFKNITIVKELFEISDVPVPSHKTGDVNNMKYAKATKLYQNGNYTEALQAFSALGDYKDAPNMVKEVKYVSAVQYYEKGDYEKAEKELSEIEDYKDASSILTEVKYAAAVQLSQKNPDLQAVTKSNGNQPN